MKKTVLLLSFLFTPSFLWAVRPPAATLEPDATWMRIYSGESRWVYYLEATRDGRVTARTETRNKIETRSGKINDRLVKDLFQEIENSDIVSSQEDTALGKSLFFKGEMLQLSIYFKGELRTVSASLSAFGQGFAHAFSQVRRAAGKTSPLRGLKGFITAEPLAGTEAKDIRKSSPDAMKLIETAELDRIKPLARAVVRPFRLIPLTAGKDIKNLNTFITAHNLRGDRKQFYLSASRGDFRCSILDAKR
ncbi:MAG: hypothetical protein ABIG11_06830 [bacterium]